MTVRQRDRRKHAAWIALAAMLLIYLGPLLTKVQLAQHAEPHAQHHHDNPSPATETGHANPLKHLAHGDCGYCVLLTKLPAMSSACTSAFRADERYARHLSVRPPCSAPPSTPRFPNAPVRAPPAMV